MAKLNINAFEVDYSDLTDMKGDIFHIQEDPDNPKYFCLIKERNGICVVVDFSEDKNKFTRRIENARRL